MLGLFAKEFYKKDYILQKRPIILSTLLSVATPYEHLLCGFVSLLDPKHQIHETKSTIWLTMNMNFENFYVNRTQVETKKFATFKEFEIERQAVRKEYIDTCPDTSAKLEVCVIYVN